ncbi:dynobactin A family peptide antibiotic [Photorhabdus tasmaniensis]|uniref:dynobactin A family peptide antibiotic n=1 Tax=Photorhabdus tasmaniensis TaxID=1004159 RepID=UPI0010DCF0D4|nr:dynobactin A family peptide antibiotic [Photorhabdus tasmaniensis]
MNDTNNAKVWNNALLDCAMVQKDNKVKDLDQTALEKLVKHAAIPSWNSNVHSYRF